MRALVLGADGFVGSHLVRHLRESGDSTMEGIGPSTPGSPGRIPVDVRDVNAMASLIRDTAPDAIYHLAAVAYGPDAAADFSAAVNITVGGTAVMLEAAAQLENRPIVLITGSSEVYGAPEMGRIDEHVPLHPANVYGATKVAQEVVALTFGRTRGIEVVATRSFNHIGPGQRDSFAIPSFARQLRKIEQGEVPPVLRVGNLTPIRDFSDVRDVVRAYRLLIVGSHSGEPVNVASGVGISIQEMLATLVRISGVDVSIEVEPARVRHNDPPRLVGDPSRIQALSGWSPTYSIEQTLADVWADAQVRW